MFFKNFGTINYTLDGYTQKAMNILTAAILKRLNVDKTFLFQKHMVADGQTIESLSKDLYNDANLGWTILLVNSIIDPFLEWPMSQNTLEAHVERNYPSPHTIVRFIRIDSGWEVDEIDDRNYRELIKNGQPLPINISPVTAMEHENQLNNARRDILVVSPREIFRFVDAFNKVIDGE